MQINTPIQVISIAENANTVLAGPTTGSGALPTFRALVEADATGILAASNLTNGVTGSGEIVLATAPTFITGITAPIVNATTGFEVNGAAAQGSILQGNGSQFVAVTTPMFLAGVMLPNPKLINTQSVALPATGTPTTAIYTVPVGRRAYFNGYGFGFTNNNVHIYPGLEISSVNYPIANGTNIGVATYTFSKLCSALLLEAGQSLTITPSAAIGAGGFFSAEIIEFDNTAPLQQVFLTTIGNGSPTTFYAPSGQGAQIIDAAFDGIGSTPTSVGNGIQFYNFTGTNATIDIYYTPNGGSQLTIDALSVATTTVDTGSSPTNFTIPVPLANGDLLALQSNQTSGSATQYAWGNVLIL